MEIFQKLQEYHYEQLMFCHDATSGLKAIICIHDTTLGPALGGTRMWDYECEEDALVDVLRLARGMTYKAAVAGLNLGGGKAVIIGNSKKDKSESLFRSFGRYVQSLGGRYITAEDVGIGPADMDYVRMETKHVTGLEYHSGSSGDPSPVTAFGVWQSMQACAKEVWGKRELTGKTVAVQGLGHVGYYLCKYLHEEGAKLIVTDINEENVQRVVCEFGAKAVAPNDIYTVDCDVYAPCALGAVVNDATIDGFKCQIICGAANNQLKELRHGELLRKRKILYAPDYVANAGGLINVADELVEDGYNRERAMRKAGLIYESIRKIIEISKRENISTAQAADILAESRIATIRGVKKVFVA